MTPRKPMSASLGMISDGKCETSSHSITCGAISPSANSRTVRRSCCCSSVRENSTEPRPQVTFHVTSVSLISHRENFTCRPSKPVFGRSIVEDFHLRDRSHEKDSDLRGTAWFGAVFVPGYMAVGEHELLRTVVSETIRNEGEPIKRKHSRIVRGAAVEIRTGERKQVVICRPLPIKDQR